LAAALLGGAAFLAAGIPAGPALAQAQQQAQQQEVQERARSFILDLSDEALSALTNPDVPLQERQSRARVLLNENFAIPTIAQWVLGRYWRVATPEQRQEYLKLFEDLIVVTYVDRFTRYSGEDLKITRVVGGDNGSDAVVFTQISRPQGKPFDVGWRVRPSEGGMKIVDVYVEGVSMGQTQRSEFASVIQNGGGQVSALLDEMRRRLQGRG
jgi:phospholipid transport system substrate-binding protein